MANENNASYAKIGFFILAGIALIAGALIYLGGAGSQQHEFLAETFFSESVSGLDVGSAVNLRGVRVGSVRRIRFMGSVYRIDTSHPEDLKKIYVEMAFDTRLFQTGDESSPRHVLRAMVEKGLHATVSSSGVTGLSHIELNFPKGKITEETHSWTPDHVLVPPAPSILQSAADSAQQILDQLNKMDFVDAWTNLVDTARNANTLIGSVNTLIGSEQGNVSAILGNVRDASQSLREFADQIKNNPSAVLRERVAPALDETK